MHTLQAARAGGRAQLTAERVAARADRPSGELVLAANYGGGAITMFHSMNPSPDDNYPSLLSRKFMSQELLNI